MTVLITIQLLVTALLAVLVVGLLRSHAEILRALHDLGVGDPDGHDHGSGASGLHPGPLPRRRQATGPATDIVGVTARGSAATLAVKGVDHATILAFLSSGCLACHTFWEEFNGGDISLPGDTRLAVVTKGPADESESRIRELASAKVQTIMSSEAWLAYEVPATPYFVLVDGPSGNVVGEGAANTWPHVMSLLQQAMADAGIAAERARIARPGADQQLSRIDRDLTAAGIHPGHPSLYPASQRQDEQEEP
jgi:hypothetical protein